jgi:cytoskeletal protein CcmA (bactofilin family)
MLKRVGFAILLAVMLSAVALPTLASQGGGGVHFGPYSLSSGDMVTGDLVVFGPVTLGEDSLFDGDLAAFGEVTVAEDATVTGDLVCFGATSIAGTVEGSVFAAGSINLAESAEVEGDVSALGSISREEGATVEGEVAPFDNGDFEWDVPFVGPFIFTPTGPRPMWQGMFWKLLRALSTVVVLSLFALLIAALWPTQMARVGRVIVDEPLPSFGVGALALLIAFIGMLILVLTICLSPFAFIAGIAVGIGIVLGWVALGAVLGERILRDVFRARHVTPLGSAVLGTALITLLAVQLNLISGCLYTLLIFPLFALVAGAVTLTRYGTMPYASRGNVPQPPAGPSPRAEAPVAPGSPVDRTPRVPKELEE